MKSYIANLVHSKTEIKSIRMWYDTHDRVWTILMLDADGNQVGDADYALGCHGLREAKKHAELYLGTLTFQPECFKPTPHETL